MLGVTDGAVSTIDERVRRVAAASRLSMELAQALVQPTSTGTRSRPSSCSPCAACLVLVADLFLPRRGKWIAMPLSAAGIFGTLAAVVSLIGDGPHHVDAGGIVRGRRLRPLVQGALLRHRADRSSAISFHYFKGGRYYQGEYYFLLLCWPAGRRRHGELPRPHHDLHRDRADQHPGFVMTALRKGDAKSNEAALKFFLFGVLSSAVMLYGMSLDLRGHGHDPLDEISDRSGRDRRRADRRRSSVFFVVVGFAFKISAVPFHFWAPDTYEGAPSPVAAFLSTASKIGGFVGLLVLMFVAFPDGRRYVATDLRRARRL